jgi:hypothetical protein
MSGEVVSLVGHATRNITIQQTRFKRIRGWVLALIVPAVMEFNKSIVEYPSIRRTPGGASTDWRPDLQRPDNPVPLLDMKNPPHIKAGGG